ncbi:STAS domain-containing protein [Aquirufa sp.]|jgi:anti-anti-sigma factor|uniref:STAS domain-containing protein n=1 Tax=Aquirufa sp. TaxID=2676249 RepID=UPI0037C0765B
MSQFNVNTEVENDLVILITEGYLNNEGGEMISNICYEHISNGNTKFLLDMAQTKVVNSIGVSILIEIIEKLQEVDGKLGYYNLAPIVDKTFKIMGLTKYSSVYSTKEEALADF